MGAPYYFLCEKIGRGCDMMRRSFLTVAIALLSEGKTGQEYSVNGKR